jgi:hypothetical protein
MKYFNATELTDSTSNVPKPFLIAYTDFPARQAPAIAWQLMKAWLLRRRIVRIQLWSNKIAFTRPSDNGNG